MPEEPDDEELAQQQLSKIKKLEKKVSSAEADWFSKSKDAAEARKKFRKYEDELRQMIRRGPQPELFPDGEDEVDVDETPEPIQAARRKAVAETNGTNGAPAKKRGRGRPKKAAVA